MPGKGVEGVTLVVHRDQRRLSREFLISCLLPYIVGSETPLPDTLE